MAEPILAVADVHTYYGDSHVLHGVSLGVAAGEVVAILGRNGMGKTTLIRSIVGFTPPRRGTVRFGDEDVTAWAPFRRIARGMALVPQGRRIFRSLTVRENLAVAARRPRPGAPAGWTLDSVFALFPRIGERRRQVAGSLSGGEQQMLAIGRALMSNPRVLLMDEPSEGLAPQIVGEVMATVRRLKSQGLSIVLVEQNPKLVFEVADDIVILNGGRVVAEGPATEFRHRDADLRQHLGIF